MVTFLLILRRSVCYIYADGETNSISTSSGSSLSFFFSCIIDYSSSGTTFNVEIDVCSAIDGTLFIFGTNFAGIAGSTIVDLLGYKFNGGILLVASGAGIDCIFLIIGSSSICGGYFVSSESLSLYFKLKRISSFMVFFFSI